MTTELELLEEDSLTIPLPKTALRRISLVEEEEEVTGGRVDTDAMLVEEGVDDMVEVEDREEDGVETTVIICPLCKELRGA